MMKSLRWVMIGLFLLTSLPLATQAFEKTSLIEYFTNTGCGPCAGQHPAVQNMLATYTRDEIAYMTYHVSWPSPSDPYYTMNSAENTARRNFYGVNAVPWFESNGTVNANPLSGVLPHAISQIGIDTPFLIEIDELDFSGAGTVDVNVTVTCAEPTAANTVFHLQFLDKLQVFPAGSNGVADYPFNVLDLAYGATGTPLSSNGGNEEITFNYTFNYDETIWTSGNLGVVAFIQNNSSDVVYQSKYRGSPEVNIGGSVMHAVTGDPIEDAAVWLNGNPDSEVLTGESGNFAFNGLGEGTYSFQITYPDMETISTDPQFFDFGNYDLDFPMVNEHDDIDMIGAVNAPSDDAANTVVMGDYAYTAAGYDGLIISDISDPMNPVAMSTTDIGARSYAIAVMGNHAFLGIDDGLVSVNVSNPSAPSVDATVALGGDVKGLDMAGDYLYAAASGDGIAVFDITNAGSPSLVTNVDSPGYARDVTVDGNYAYMADGAGGLTVWNISNPASPTVAGTADTDGYATAVTKDGNRVFIGDDSNDVVVFNVATPGSPAELADLDLQGRAKDLVVVDDVLIVASNDYGVRAFNVANLNNVTELGFSLTPGTTLGIAVDGMYGYASDTGHMLVFDLSGVFGGGAPAALTLTGTQTNIPAGGGTLAYNVSFEYNLPNPTPGVAYWSMVTGPGGDQVGPLTFQAFTAMPGMDVTVPISHMVPGAAPAGTYTMTGYVGFYPNNAPLMDSFTFTKAGANVDGSVDLGDWTTTGNLGVLAGEADDAIAATPNAFELKAVYPNPFNPTTTVTVALPQAADLTVAVYNVMGQQVAELVNSRVDAGTQQYTFNASHLASGLYFVRATVPGELNAVQKVMLVR